VRAKTATTDIYRSVDVRRWKRDSLTNPHQAFDWQWSHHGEVTASIRKTKAIPSISTGPPVILADNAPGSCVLLVVGL